jgi:ribonuclease T1
VKRQRTIGALLAALVAAALGWWLGTATAEESAPATTTVTVTVTAAPAETEPQPVPDEPAATGTDAASGLPWIAAFQLPPEGRETLELIEAGGPFPYERDGTVFQNRESILPDESRGYYREYTVPTPGSDDRGARRIVAGSGGELYYTDDHYESFGRIRP